MNNILRKSNIAVPSPLNQIGPATRSGRIVLTHNIRGEKREAAPQGQARIPSSSPRRVVEKADRRGRNTVGEW